MRFGKRLGVVVYLIFLLFVLVSIVQRFRSLEEYRMEINAYAHDMVLVLNEASVGLEGNAGDLIPDVLWFHVNHGMSLLPVENEHEQEGEGFDLEDSSNLKHNVQTYQTFLQKKTTSNSPVRVSARFMNRTLCIHHLNASFPPLLQYFEQEVNVKTVADMCTLATLHQEGGYYLDASLAVREPFVVSERRNVSFVGSLACLEDDRQCSRKGKCVFSNKFMATVPHHAFLRMVLRRMYKLYQNDNDNGNHEEDGNTLSTTTTYDKSQTNKPITIPNLGPMALTQEFYRLQRWKKAKENANMYLLQETYAYHSLAPRDASLNGNQEEKDEDEAQMMGMCLVRDVSTGTTHFVSSRLVKPPPVQSITTAVSLHASSTSTTTNNNDNDNDKDKIVKSNSTPIQPSNTTTQPVQFLFIVGVEGTGHHLFNTLHAQSPMGQFLAKHKMKPLTANLHHALFQNKFKTNGVWSATSNTGHVLANGRKVYKNLVDQLRGYAAKVRENQQKDFLNNNNNDDEKLLPTTVHFPLNCYSGTNAGENSYPNWFGEFREMQYPDLRPLYRACDEAMVKCHHVVIVRDAYAVARSVSIKRHFQDRESETKLLSVMSKVIRMQLVEFAERTVGCIDYDDISSFYKVGKLLGWESDEEFQTFFDGIFQPHAATSSNTTLMESIVPPRFKVFMDTFVKDMEEVHKACLRGLEYRERLEEQQRQGVLPQ